MAENGSYIETQEQQVMFRARESTNARHVLIFNHRGSAGYQTRRLAQLTTTFDYVMALLGWEFRAFDLTDTIRIGQTTIDGRYHNDFKEIAIAEEKQTKLAERRGLIQ